MRVWIVNPYDNLPPEGYRPQRFWLMARAFAASGCAVTLWTSAFSHATKAPRRLAGEANAERLPLRIAGEGFEVVCIPAPGYRANVGIGRIVNHRILAHRWRRMAEAAQRPDLVIASSPPLGLVAEVRKFARRKNIPYIVDVMDAWPETFERVLPKGVLKALGLYRIARANYRGAARIAVVAKRYAELVRGHGFTGEVREFPHGIERTTRAEVPHPPIGPHPELRLAYVGNMSLSYDLETLVKAVCDLPDVTLDLAGDGPDRAHLEQVVEKAGGCDRIRFHGYLEAARLESLLAQSDAGVIPMFTASGVGVPYKLADYVAAGLPVVNSLEGETAELLAAYKAGLSYRADDPHSFRKALTVLKTADHEALRCGARRLAECFDAKRIYADYVVWARQALGARVPTDEGAA